MADVVVLGSFMVDLVVRAPRRPMPGETIVGTSFEQHLGGKGCNQAVAAARAGVRTAMIGRVGDDEYGRRFLDLLAREGIDASAVATDAAAGTGVATPLVEPSGENSIVIVPRANHAVAAADVDAAAPLLTGARVLLLQLELPLPRSSPPPAAPPRRGVTVVLNPAPAVGDLAARFEGLVDVLVPNEVEAAALTGIDGDPLAAAKALRERFGCAVVVTLGAQGSLVLQADGAARAGPRPPRRCRRHRRRRRRLLRQRSAPGWPSGTTSSHAARYASAAGSLSVMTPGAEPSLPTAGQVDAAPRLRHRLPGGPRDHAAADQDLEVAPHRRADRRVPRAGLHPRRAPHHRRRGRVAPRALRPSLRRRTTRASVRSAAYFDASQPISPPARRRRAAGLRQSIRPELKIPELLDDDRPPQRPAHRRPSARRRRGPSSRRGPT